MSFRKMINVPIRAFRVIRGFFLFFRDVATSGSTTIDGDERHRCVMPRDGEMIHRELSERIIGAAMFVLNELGPGLDEKIYERALVLALTDRGLQVDQQHRYVVKFQDREVGILQPDLIVENKVIVDTKVVEAFNENHIAKMISYLAFTKLELAILVNFKFARLRWKRVVRTYEPKGPGAPEVEMRTADDADGRG